MSDLICRNTMQRCQTPGMCLPHGGCRVSVLADSNVRYSNSTAPDEAMTIDKAQLKAMAEAANAVTTDVNITMAVGSAPEEVKAVQDYLQTAMPKTVLALLAEIERLEAEVKRMTSIAYAAHGAFRMETLAERDQLKAEKELAEEARDLYSADKKRLMLALNDARAEAEALRSAVLYGSEFLAKVTSKDGSGHADLALAVLRKAGFSSADAACQVGSWVAERAWQKKEPDSVLSNG